MGNPHLCAMIKTLVTCPCCHGAGRTFLTAILEETLAVLSPDEWTSTHQVIEKMGNPWNFRPTAFNNRLGELQKFGLVKSQRRGKALFWMPAKRAKKKAA